MALSLSVNSRAVRTGSDRVELRQHEAFEGLRLGAATSLKYSSLAPARCSAGTISVPSTPSSQSRSRVQAAGRREARSGRAEGQRRCGADEFADGQAETVGEVVDTRPTSGSSSARMSATASVGELDRIRVDARGIAAQPSVIRLEDERRRGPRSKATAGRSCLRARRPMPTRRPRPPAARGRPRRKARSPAPPSHRASPPSRPEARVDDVEEEAGEHGQVLELDVAIDVRVEIGVERVQPGVELVPVEGEFVVADGVGDAIDEQLEQARNRVRSLVDDVGRPVWLKAASSGSISRSGVSDASRAGLAQVVNGLQGRRGASSTFPPPTRGLGAGRSRPTSTFLRDQPDGAPVEAPDVVEVRGAVEVIASALPPGPPRRLPRR